MKPLLSESELENAKRILFMSHPDLSDIIYQGPLLKAFKKAYPALQVEIWLDDCKDRPKGNQRTRSDALKQWIQHMGITDVVFPMAKDRSDRQNLIRQARRRNYDIIFYMAPNRCVRYAQAASGISKRATIVGNTPQGWLNKLKGFRYLRHVDKRFLLAEQPNETHVSKQLEAIYSQCFGDLPVASNETFGANIELSEQSNNKAQQWLSENVSANASPLIMINPLSVSRKRDLSGAVLLGMIDDLHHAYPDLHVIINVPTSSLPGMRALLKTGKTTVRHPAQVSLFSTTDDVFVLPALMGLCDCIITVEAPLTHLASSMGIPQLAVLRGNAKQWQPLRALDVLWCNEDVREAGQYEVNEKALACVAKALKLRQRQLQDMQLDFELTD